MKRHSYLLACAATAALLAFATSASAAQLAPGVIAKPGAGGADSVAVRPAEQMSARERKALSNALTTKWSAYVQRVYSVPASEWVSRMASGLAVADASNLRNALTRDTFEGAMSEINGTGGRMSDTKVIDALAASGGGSTQAFGELTKDLVYTPVTPCRIVDTRVAGGVISANGSRNFVAFGVSSFTSQGGSATNCGVNPLAATAVAINLTAVSPSIAGYVTAYPYGTTKPTASSINYAAGAIVNNALIVQTPNPISAFDFTLYSYGQAHYVADIVGYFAPPVATALQCVDTADTVTSVLAGATANSTAPACAAGYTQTATNCESSTWQMPFVFFSGGTCSAQNNSPATATLRASRTCCRVPGR